jgi:hypothetical protein
VRLRVLSDLRVEFAAFEPPPLDVDAVVLAGDIKPRGYPHQPVTAFDAARVVELG